MQRSAQREAEAPLLSVEQLRSAAGISHALGVLSAELSQQGDVVRALAGEAEESLDNVRRGNAELLQAVARPSTLRDTAVALLLGLCAIIVFLDWHAP